MLHTVSYTAGRPRPDGLLVGDGIIADPGMDNAVKVIDNPDPGMENADEGA
jgi:hypothetical protein